MESRDKKTLLRELSEQRHPFFPAMNPRHLRMAPRKAPQPALMKHILTLLAAVQKE